MDRINFSGDYRFEAHSIWGNVPAHYDGMQLQNLMVKTLWLFTPTNQGGLGMTFDPNLLSSMTPTQFAGFIGQTVQQNYSQYQFFSSNLTFNQLKAVDRTVLARRCSRLLANYLTQAPGVLPERLQQRHQYPVHQPSAPQSGLEDQRRSERHRAPEHVQGMGRFHRRAGLRRPAVLDEH